MTDIYGKCQRCGSNLTNGHKCGGATRCYRQHIVRDVLLSPYYNAHVRAMTAESLHDKCEIAEELTYRDMQIEKLRADLAIMTQAVGLATTIKGDMVIRPDDPIGMMQEVCAHVAAAQADTARLDYLERNPRHAQIVIDGVTTDCIFYGISCAKLVPLRDALDVAMDTP